jgi:aminotransferase
VGAPAPFQEAIATALEQLGDDYYADLADGYRERRDVLYQGLVAAGFKCAPPAGAYYILADFSDLSDRGDVDYAKWLARGGSGGEGGGVASVPGSSFYSEHALGRHLTRFAFCKTLPTLQAGVERLKAIARENRG